MMSVNESALKNVQIHNLLPLWGASRCGTKCPTGVVRIATLLEFDENYIFLTAFCSIFHESHPPTFLHILPEKRCKEWFSRKLFELKIKLDKMLKD
jgi:hypothetical protein